MANFTDFTLKNNKYFRQFFRLHITNSCESLKTNIDILYFLKGDKIGDEL